MLFELPSQKYHRMRLIAKVEEEPDKYLDFHYEDGKLWKDKEPYDLRFEWKIIPLPGNR